MKEIFSQKWVIATVATWVAIITLDEIAYYWWKKLNPGTQYYSTFGRKQSLTPWYPAGGDEVPNGFRPGGGINVAG